MIFAKQSTIVAQLANWQLLPQPERVSELYFTDHSKLPTLLNAHTTHPVDFTVRNIEHRTITYHYKLVATLPDSDTEQALAEGTFSLNHQDSYSVSEDIVVPALGPRIGIRVDLYYKTSDSTESIATQSINYWTAVNAVSQALLWANHHKV